MSRFENLDKYSKAATKIQAGMRGHLTRKDYKNKIEEAKSKAKVLETYRTDKYMIDQFCYELKKRKLTCDKFYRICDGEMRQRITTKQFIDEINNLGIDFSEPTKKKLVLVFDEDFNEYITYKEFIETCEAFGAELPLELPKDYVSVSKRALMKVVKKMKKKGIKPDFLFKMKDTDEVDIEDFKHFFRNTINARIKKREEHSLFVLCDKDRNNTVNKEEFVSLYKKGEKFLDEPNMPVKNNLFGPDEAAEEIEDPISKRKPKLVKQETSMQYSGDAKSEIVKIIHERDFISIEQFLSSAFNWDFDDFVSYDDLENKATQLMPSIPGEDLRALFDDLDTSGEERIKVKNLIKVLKDEIHKQGNDKTSLLTVEDVISQYGSKSPRSCSSLAIQELKEHCESSNYRLEEIFRVSKEGHKKYTTKKRLRAEIRNSLPSLSRSLIEEVLNDFPEENINFTEYLIYFDLKDIRKRDDASLSKDQKKWIKKYTEVLNKHKVSPDKLMQEADTNNDGVISLKELKKATKEYIPAKELSFKELQHILDAFDINHDGKVTAKEYQATVKKYRASEEGSDIVEKIVKACRDNDSSLKEGFSKCDFNTKGQISISTAQRKIKSTSGLDASEINELMELFKDGGKKTSITGDEIFNFYDQNIPDDPNIRLEIKYLLKRAEIEKSDTILNYLDNDLGFDLEEDLLKKEFNDNLGDTLHFGKSSLKHLYKEVKNVRPEIPNPNIVDFYTLILNCRDEDLLESQKENPEEIKEKVQKRLSRDYKNSTSPIQDLGKDTEFDFSKSNNEEISLAEFMETFVERKGYVTSKEAMILFDDINETPEGALKTSRPKIICSKINVYFSNNKPSSVKTPPPEEAKTPEKNKTPKKDPQKNSPKNIPKPKDQESIIHQLEMKEKKFLPLVFNVYQQQKLVTKSGILKVLKIVYSPSEGKYSKQDIKSAADALLDGEDKIKFQKFFENVKSSSLMPPSSVDKKELGNIFKNEIKLCVKKKEPFDPEKKAGFVNAILKDESITENDYYLKYHYINEFYRKEEEYQLSAKNYILQLEERAMKNKEKSVPLPNEKNTKEDRNKVGKDEQEAEGETDDDEEEKIPDKNQKPGGLLGLLTGDSDKDEGDQGQDPKKLLGKLKGKLEVDFDKLIQSKLQQKGRKSVKLSEKEREEFNNIMKGFIKDFTKIIPEEDLNKKDDRLNNLITNVEMMDIFNREKGGSKRMEELIKKYNNKEVKTANIDLLDLWKEVEKWPKFDIKKVPEQKYIFAFLKLNPETFTVNLKELEKFYVKTTKSNKKYKVKEMEEILTDLRDELVNIGKKEGENPDDSLHFESKVKIKGGVRYNKNSVEELIHNLIEYSNANKVGDKSLLSIYKEHVEPTEEATINDLKSILDKAGLKNNETQRKDLLRLLDSDKDLHLSYDELKSFLETYDKEKPLKINIFKNVNGKKNKFRKLQEILNIKCELKPDDYFFPDCKTILNSDIAALKKVEFLLDELEKSGKDRFIDLEFGPKDENDEEGNKMALYTTGEAPRGYIKPEQIEWLYPKEICPEDSKIDFLVGESSSNEVIQGALGDCWFIGALSVLATRDELLIGGADQYKIDKDLELTDRIAREMSEGVYPPIFHGYARHGIYVFRFFKNFNWRYVIIDERIPCYKSNGTPVFGRCSNLNELWVPLIEKAYAKLHKCYQSLVSGFIDDGLTDLTGFVAEKINLHNKHGMFPNKKIGTKEEFWNYLQQRRKEESMLGCARKDETVEGQVIIDGEPTGILSRHAYGLLDVFTIESQENGEEFKLLRIRNPWGKTEWVGDWSDNSEEIEKYRKELDVYVEELEDDEKFEIGEEDGTFIINFEDWSTIYNKLYVTIDFPPSWTGFRFTDSWNKGNSGGLPMPSAGITAKDAQISWGKNPQYLINQNKNGTVEFFFSLAQNDGRIEGKYIFPFVEIIDPICLIIYPAEDGKAVSKFDGSKVNPAWISTVVEHKEVSLRAMLPKGKYIVVPSQRQPSSDERPYYLSIYFNGSIGEVSFKNLKNPGNNGEEIKEEDEEIEVSQLRQDIIKTRLEDIYDSNVERKKPKIFN